MADLAVDSQSIKVLSANVFFHHDFTSPVDQSTNVFSAKNTMGTDLPKFSTAKALCYTVSMYNCMGTNLSYNKTFAFLESLCFPKLHDRAKRETIAVDDNGGQMLLRSEQVANTCNLLLE